MTNTAPSKAHVRKAYLSYASNEPLSYPALGLEEIILCAESDNGDAQEHLNRAVALARTLPAGTVMVINAEHYGLNNVLNACTIIGACQIANPEIRLSAYLPEQTLPVWDALGQSVTSRRKSISTVLETTRALKKAGASFASIDGYVRMAASTLGIVDYFSSGWRDCWNTAVGQAATLVEALLPPVVWVSNRVVANGLPIAPQRIEPLVPEEDFAKMLLFVEARGWDTISLLGWSDTRFKRLNDGRIPLENPDKRTLHALKHLPGPRIT